MAPRKRMTTSKAKSASSKKTFPAFRPVKFEIETKQEASITTAPELPRHEFHPAPSYSQSWELPSNYGDNLIYLLVRDPYCIYAYWEIQKDHEQNALNQLGNDRGVVHSILRVYDITDNRQSPSFFDIPLQNLAQNWYIDVQPNRTYFVEIGLLHRDGRFIALARSNEVTTPRSGMSDIIDEEWMSIDFDKMYALSGGFGLGKSSMELKRLMQENLWNSTSSGSGGFSPVKKKDRKFWFVLDCELIVYGATEPDAKVTMQGKNIQLRPDGTFTLRFALPDGKLTLDARAESSDGIEEREITPIVTRKTQRPAPKLKSKKP